MTGKQYFPRRRPDGTATVVAIFGVPLASVSEEVDLAFDDWRRSLSHIDMAKDLVTEPVALPSEEGFRITFEARAGTRRWRDWMVALLGALERRLGDDYWVAIRDEVSGRTFPVSRKPPQDERD